MTEREIVRRVFKAYKAAVGDVTHRVEHDEQGKIILVPVNQEQTEPVEA